MSFLRHMARREISASSLATVTTSSGIMDVISRQVRSRGGDIGTPSDALDQKRLATHRFVAYVWDSDTCHGSSVLCKLVEPFKEDVLFVDVTTLSHPLPTWLHGTPTVVDIRDPTNRQAYKGSSALQILAEAYRTDIPE